MKNLTRVKLVFSLDTWSGGRSDERSDVGSDVGSDPRDKRCLIMVKPMALHCKLALSVTVL